MKISTDAHLRVAKHAMGIAQQNNAQYKAMDKDIAHMMADMMTKMVLAEDKQTVNDHVESMIHAHKVAYPGVKTWAYLCMYANWLSWGWHAEGQDELSGYWADAWYKLNDFTIDTLKGDELSKYLSITN